MSALSAIKSKIRRFLEIPERRDYSGASISRLTSDWLMNHSSADAELWGNVKTLRARAREAERNDPYARRYLSLCENNVLGATGIGIQMKVEDSRGILDNLANQAIEDAKDRWNRRENCCVNRRYTWYQIEKLVLRSVKRDGACLVRIQTPFQNEFGFAVQLIEIDQLDTDFNVGAPSGNQIRMGVEVDQWGAPVAYHLLRYHPGDNFPLSAMGGQRERVPISEMLHIFDPDRVGQTTGAPALSSVLMMMKMLQGYQEAELVAAREAACKGYAIETQTPVQYSGETDAKGRSLQDIEPGMGLPLNPGEKYVPIDPQHPTQAFPQFVKAMLRGISGGLNVSYNSIANDLESVNYSSLRAGLLDEREEWKATQQWLIDELERPIFEAWLRWCLQNGKITLPNGSALPLSRFDKFNKPDFKPRRWAWVDPLKDAQANVILVEKGFTSRRRVIAEEGGDIEEIFREQAADKDLADQYDLEFPIEGVQKSPGTEGDQIDDANAASAPPARVDLFVSPNGKDH